MSKRKLSPLVQAMGLYNQLDDRDKATLADYIRSQQSPKPSTARNAGKRLSPRSVAVKSTPSTETGMDTAIGASN